MTPTLTSPLLDALPGVRHGFFTRQGGVSEGVYASLNAGLGSKDDPEAVRENRRRIAAHFDLAADRLVTAYQVHSATALPVKDAAQARAEPRRGDALVTSVPGIVCGALSADCAPVLLVDPKARVVASVHAGWKGALAGVTDMALTAMSSDFGAAIRDIVAVIGPCIGPASYEVGEEFLDRFESEDAGSSRFFRRGAWPDKRLFDLPAYVLDRLARAGVGTAEWIGRDTYAEPEHFFSNRRAVHRGEADYGRLLSAIVLT